MPVISRHVTSTTASADAAGAAVRPLGPPPRPAAAAEAAAAAAVAMMQRRMTWSNRGPRGAVAGRRGQNRSKGCLLEDWRTAMELKAVQDRISAGVVAPPFPSSEKPMPSTSSASLAPVM
jgi:hypothetical protein